MQPVRDTSDPVKELYQTYQQQGREAAATTGDQKPDLVLVSTIQRTIDPTVKALWMGPVDPGNRKDALLLDALKESEETRRQAETVLVQAQRKANEAQFATPAQEPPVNVPFMVVLFAILALAGTFSLSLVELDAFTQMIDDDVLRLGAAALLGLAIAGACIGSLFDLGIQNKDASVVRPKAMREIYILIAEVVLSAAFGFIRFSNSDDDPILTIGLVAVDVGVLLYATSSAVQHRNRVAVHAERNDARLQFEKKRDDALKELELATVQLDDAKAEHQNQVEKLESRLKLDFDPGVVAKAAFASWEDAYFRQLAENRNPSRPSLFQMKSSVSFNK